jgi:uncharacterized protein YktB (UPF0637 family)
MVQTTQQLIVRKGNSLDGRPCKRVHLHALQELFERFQSLKKSQMRTTYMYKHENFDFQNYSKYLIS